ncbi:MAG: hypothetical protein WD844_17685 [Thermoleophilaceae bacterium]
MTFERLKRADWIAWGAALVLVASLALDWYGTQLGDEARRIEGLAEPSETPSGQVERDVREDARVIAEGEERNAFQADGAIDRVILVVLLAAALLIVVAVFVRAGGRSPAKPMAAAAVAGAAGAVLVAYRIVQEPGLDAGTTVKVGALLALVASGVLALAARTSARAEREEVPAAPTSAA